MIIASDIYHQKLLKTHKEATFLFEFYPSAIPSKYADRIFFLDYLLNESSYSAIEEECNNIVHEMIELGEKYLHINNLNLIEPNIKDGRENLFRFLRFKFAIKNIGVPKSEIKYVFDDSLMISLVDTNDIIRKKPNHSFTSPKEFSKIIIRQILIYIFDNLHFLIKNKQTNILWSGGKNTTSTITKKISQKSNFITFSNHPQLKLALIKNKIFYKNLGKKKLTKGHFALLDKSYQTLLNDIMNVSIKYEIPYNFLLKAFNIKLDVFHDYLLTIQNFINAKKFINAVVVEQSIKNTQLILAKLCNKYNIPSIEILHGIPSGIEVGNTKFIAVVGPRDKDYFIENGISAKKIFITGSPKYDIYQSILKTSESDFYAEHFTLIIDIIDYRTPKSSQFDNYILIQQTIKAITKYPKEKLIIKLHPRQTIKELNYWKTMVAHISQELNCTNSIEVVKGYDLLQLIKNSKAVITHNSSVGVESILTNTPLIVLDLIEGRKISYEKFGVAQVVKTQIQFQTAINKFIDGGYEFYNSNKKNFLKSKIYFCGENFDDSTNKTFRKVYEIINNQKEFKLSSRALCE